MNGDFREEIRSELNFFVILHDLNKSQRTLNSNWSSSSSIKLSHLLLANSSDPVEGSGFPRLSASFVRWYVAGVKVRAKGSKHNDKRWTYDAMIKLFLKLRKKLGCLTSGFYVVVATPPIHSIMYPSVSFEKALFITKLISLIIHCYVTIVYELCIIKLSSSPRDTIVAAYLQNNQQLKINQILLLIQ